MMSAKTSPFTAIQLQELEQQALIFKYMLSGSQVPPYLVSTVKRSLESSLLFPHHQPIGWGSFQMGFGRKPDPEPGRCRRTDGKKWRCSKEAHPDSKYCERHMHRGRNRSRKPVEITTSTPIPTIPTTTSISYSPLSSLHDNLFLCPSSSSSRLDTDYSYIHGVRHEMGLRELSVTPATSPCGYLQFQGLTGESREEQEKRHCFVLGKDFKSSASPAREEGKQRPFHHFFGECSSSLENEEISLSSKPNFSATRLSTSMPPSTRG